MVSIPKSLSEYKNDLRISEYKMVSECQNIKWSQNIRIKMVSEYKNGLSSNLQYNLCFLFHIFSYLFFSGNILPVCMYVLGVCAWSPQSLKDDIRFLGTKVKVVVSCHVNVRNQSLVLCQFRKCS